MKVRLASFILASQVLTITCPAQTTPPRTITLAVRHASLADVVDSLERTDCCRFPRKPNDLRSLYVTITLNNVPIRVAVDSIFRDQPLVPILNDSIGGPYSFSLQRAATLQPAECVTNGLQQLSLTTEVGSVAYRKGPEVHRVISPSVLDQLPGLTPALLSDLNVNNQLNWSIHGPNSIHAVNSPAIILDGFVYFGNWLDINPNDVDTQSVLKDAAAGSIWGAVSGAGVIVLNTFGGAPAKPARFTFIQNFTVVQKPQLSYIPQISNASYIAREDSLFTAGYYDGLPRWAPISPGVQLLYLQRSHQLSPPMAAAGIAYLGSFDRRKEELRYLYRTSVNQQFLISASGGAGKDDYYYLSLGYDRVPSSLVRNDYQRITTQLTYTLELIPNKLKIATTFHLASTSILTNNPGSVAAGYPYGPLADSKGIPLPVYGNNTYNPFYTDTAGGGQLLPWTLKPLQELALANNRLQRTSRYIDVRMRWDLTQRIYADAEYRNFVSSSEQRNLNDQNSFYVRDMVNRFSQSGPLGITHNIPIGDMLNVADTSSQSHHVRLKVNYDILKDTVHELTVFAGTDLNDYSITAHSYWQYGVDPRNGQDQPVNYDSSFTDYVKGTGEFIPGTGELLGRNYRYLSGYGNVNYVYHKKLSIYALARKDATNITGQTVNLQSAPFWAFGLAWIAANDQEHDSAVIGFLKLRGSVGTSGNIGYLGNVRTAYLQAQSLGPNLWGAPMSGISGAPNPGLSWETTLTANFGVDFGIFKEPSLPKGRLHGSLDGYWKQSLNQLGYDTLPPSAGVPLSFFGNTAATRGHGIDVVLTSENLRDKRGDFQWTSTLLFSWATDKITRYRFRSNNDADYIANRYPQVGKSSTALYAYNWAGLSPDKGDPQGWLNGSASNKYTALLNDSAPLHAYSSYQPQVFGTLMQSFRYKRLELSALFTLKAAYWFRRPAMNYSLMILGGYPGTKDYDHRWMAPGDEKKTSVPSFPDSGDWTNTARDAFYAGSTVLVTKGDNIRWQDLRLDYTVIQRDGKHGGIRQLDVYGYASGLGIVWKSNRSGVDPDAPVYGNVPEPKTWSVGMKMNL